MRLFYPRELDSAEWDSIQGSRLHSAMILNRLEFRPRVAFRTSNGQQVRMYSIDEVGGRALDIERRWLLENCEQVFYSARSANRNEKVYFASKTDMLKFVFEFQGTERIEV